MAAIYRKTVTKALPDGAEIIERKGERLARWKDAKGRTRTAPVTVPANGKHAGKTRIVLTSRTFTAKYRDVRESLSSIQRVAETRLQRGKCWRIWCAGPNWSRQTY